MVNRSDIGHGLAKVLGIKVDEVKADPVTRGESVFSVNSADTYVEDEPTIWEWFAEYKPTRRAAGLYVYNLFPFIHWIGRYNLQWLYGDLVAGEHHCAFFRASTKLILNRYYRWCCRRSPGHGLCQACSPPS